jgi:hypothetical protein
VDVEGEMHIVRMPMQVCLCSQCVREEEEEIVEEPVVEPPEEPEVRPPLIPGIIYEERPEPPEIPIPPVIPPPPVSPFLPDRRCERR